MTTGDLTVGSMPRIAMRVVALLFDEGNPEWRTDVPLRAALERLFGSSMTEALPDQEAPGATPAALGSLGSEVDHPEINLVVYPVHLDGSPTGALPRMRHRPDCGHFKWPDNSFLGEAVPATEKQMRDLPACKSCVNRSTRAR